MNTPLPITPIPGVPDQLVQVLNARFRAIAQPAAARSAAGGGLGTLALYANGVLAIQADCAPAVWLWAHVSPAGAMAYVKTAPTGAAIAGTIYAGSASWATFTIAIGATSATIATGGSLPAGQQIRLALTAVGTTIPGSDLAVFIYY